MRYHATDIRQLWQGYDTRLAPGSSTIRHTGLVPSMLLKIAVDHRRKGFNIMHS